MSLLYSYSYVDPETGQVVDVMVPDEDESDEYRNAEPWDRRWPARPLGGSRPPLFPGRPGRPRPSRPQAGRPRPQTGRPRPPHERPGYPPPYVPTGPVIVRELEQPAVQTSREHIAIRKSALIEIIPIAGQLWASFLGRPGMPRATGDAVIDRDNAALHRDALARHTQNQTRILALTDLAARALRVIME